MAWVGCPAHGTHYTWHWGIAGTGICLSPTPIAWFYHLYTWDASIRSNSIGVPVVWPGVLKLAHFSPTLDTQPLPHVGSSGTHGQGQSKPWSLEGHAPKMLAYRPWPSPGVRATGSHRPFTCPAPGPSHSFQRAGWIFRAQPLPHIVHEHREGHHLGEI